MLAFLHERFRPRVVRAFLSLGLASLLVAAARAQSPSYFFARANYSVQTSSSNLDYDFTNASGGIVTANASDYGDAYYEDGNGAYLDTLGHGSTDYNYGSPSFNSAAAYDAAFPEGAYRFHLLSGDQPDLFLPIDTTQTPALSEVPLIHEYDAITHAVAGQAYTLHLDGVTGHSFDVGLLSYLGDQTTGQNVTVHPTGSNATGWEYDIPDDLLVAGHTYGLETGYITGYTDTSTGFEGSIYYENVSSLGFTVQAVPEPAPLAFLAFGTLALLRRRRK